MSDVGRRTLAPVVVVLVLASGCAEDEPDAPTRQLSRTEFIEWGDRACRRAREGREDVIHRLKDGRLPDGEEVDHSPGDQGRYLDALLSPFEDLIAELRALRPPPDAQQLADRLVAAVEAHVDDIEAARALADRDDPEAIRRTPGQLETRPGFLRLANELHAYGFRICGLGPFERG
jgi:hypothetical protein